MVADGALGSEAVVLEGVREGQAVVADGALGGEAVVMEGVSRSLAVVADGVSTGKAVHVVMEGVLRDKVLGCLGIALNPRVVCPFDFCTCMPLGDSLVS